MRQKIVPILLWVLVALLLFWVLRTVPLRDIGAVLQQLTPWQIIVLIIVNAIVLLVFGGRWWALLKAMGHHVSYTMIALHRLAGFGVSYFTPGPQVGGEIVQVRLVQQRHQVPLPTILASVGLDKLIEILINLSFIFAAIIFTLRQQFIAANENLTIALVAVIFMLPMSLLFMLWRGHTPLSWVIQRIPYRILPVHLYQTVNNTISESESQIVDLFQKNPQSLLFAIAISIASWGAILLEYWLIVRFLGVTLPFQDLIAVLLAQQIAFLLPLPGGLGALEASQVFMFESLGYDPALGLSVSLLMRGRDVLFGLFGLLWASQTR